MSETLLGMYGRIKKALEEAGGYEALDDEQRELFNHAVDKLMAAKFEHIGPEEVLDAVAAFLESASSESEALPKEEEPLPEEDPTTEYSLSMLRKHRANMVVPLIRAADALDRAGQRELASELDAILAKLAEQK